VGIEDRETIPKLVIQPQRGLLQLDLASLWQYRELIYFLVWRDVKVRYKQTLIGVAWAIIQPLTTMIIFTVVFGKLAKIPSDGLPYPVFAYTALLPWNYFSSALMRSGTSLVGNSGLITKVYFPRLVVPLAAATTPAVDFAVSFTILLGLMAYYGITPTLYLIYLPFFMLLALLTALSVGLWLSPLHIMFRDVGYLLPFLTQIWMYASPVVYPVSLVPEQWRWAYSLNPMVGVIEGFRWALLGKENPGIAVIGVSASMVLIIFIGGVIFFKRMENTFADKM